MIVFSFADGQVVESEGQVTLEQARADKQAEADAIASSILDDITSRYSSLEKSTWTKKREQAEAFLASGLRADCPALLQEATATARILSSGEPPEELIAEALNKLALSIVAKSQEIEALQAQVIGWRSAMSEMLEQLPTVSAVQDFPIQVPI